MAMDKYGAYTPTDASQKQASASLQNKVICPLCRKEAEVFGQVIKCPTHGTEPFEKKKP